MTHQHNAITSNDEIVCSTCGIVLGNTIEYPYMPKQSTLFLNVEQHTQSFAHTNYKDFGTSHEKYYAEQTIKVYTRLRDICNKRNLPLHFASDAMRVLLARKRGLWSYKWQLITLVQILSSVDDKRLSKHIRELKKVSKDAKGT